MLLKGDVCKQCQAGRQGRRSAQVRAGLVSLPEVKYEPKFEPTPSPPLAGWTQQLKRPHAPLSVARPQ
jgi:hypothetical protein